MDIVQHLSSARSGILNNDNSQLLNWGLWVHHRFVTGIQSFLCRIISISTLPGFVLGVQSILHVLTISGMGICVALSHDASSSDCFMHPKQPMDLHFYVG